MDRIIKIKNINFSNQSSNKTQGKIVGKKTLKGKKDIYLIEFFNYNRLWVLENEFQRFMY